MSVIGICGDSGSGKSTLSNILLKTLNDGIILDCDRYHKWERGNENWKNITHLNPEANHIELMKSHIASLKQGKSVLAADYCHDTGTFTTPQTIGPAKHTIVTGLHSLYSSDYDLSIFMDIEPSLRKHWKVNRDVKERGYSLQQVLDSIKKREGDYLRYVLPQRDKADLIVRFFGDSLTVTMNGKFNLTTISQTLHAHRANYSIAFSDRQTSITFLEYQTIGGQNDSFYDHITHCIFNGITI
jgi:uridine kinase